jgi:alpha-tubulin suppressor-like RCC1 family protein
VWSCGVNDEGCLGRLTENVPNPSNPKEFLDSDELSVTPYPIQSLLDENFRAVKVAAGDSISAAISSEGDLRIWGSFRVGFIFITSFHCSSNRLCVLFLFPYLFPFSRIVMVCWGSQTILNVSLPQYEFLT